MLSSAATFCHTRASSEEPRVIYMGRKDMQPAPILDPMPGPWGDAVRVLMAKKGISQRTLAKRAGLSKGAVGTIVHGRHTLTSQLQAVADYFKVGIEDLFTISSTPGHHFATRALHESQGGGSHVQGATLPHADAELKELRAHVHRLENKLAKLAAQQAIEHGAARERVTTPRVRKSARADTARAARTKNAHGDTPVRKSKP